MTLLLAHSSAQPISLSSHVHKDAGDITDDSFPCLSQMQALKFPEQAQRQQENHGEIVLTLEPQEGVCDLLPESAQGDVVPTPDGRSWRALSESRGRWRRVTAVHTG